MEAEVLKSVGAIAGIGGIALGVFLLLFRDIIRKNIFPTLPPQEAYRLLRLIAIAVWSVALAGIAAWVYVSRDEQTGNVTAVGGVATQGDLNAGDIKIQTGP